MSYGVVWFKRDLRLHDHAALCAAALEGPLLCLYIIEPSLWQQPDASSQHYHFVLECLQDLDDALARRGGQLLVRVGEACAVLEELYRAAPFAGLYSHEETGNGHTFQRDKDVALWCQRRAVRWREFPQTGVIRRLSSRDGWAERWERFVAQPCLPVPPLRGRPLPLPLQPWPSAAALGVFPFDPPARQCGGRRRAIVVLRSFIEQRSTDYRGGISSPLSAPTACSRLSPYLATGCLSLREVLQATLRRLDCLPEQNSRQRQGLQAFISRLHWHCHFMQKLESEPDIEYCNMHRGYDGLRENEMDASRLAILMEGRTGWPMVDACVAMLNHTGWLNFRMRAMLVSVAAYPLWLHWRPVGLWLARAFLDYEPGIHWSQLQMQSGTTGINATRVYNPVKQALDHDPQGRFVRHWLPALRQVPDTWLFEPWKMPPALRERYNLHENVYPAQPPVELDSATRVAKQRLHGLRKQAAVKAGKAAIVTRHASRQQSLGSVTPTRADAAARQLDLFA
ncbi:MAG: deoxyribodipyrimidine photo-lyase [Burkholderiaceae bacterium]|nr:deoxyribodipyrimidine photo-lyase [Burkholderiaceae bacterium]